MEALSMEIQINFLSAKLLSTKGFFNKDKCNSVQFNSSNQIQFLIFMPFKYFVKMRRASL